MPIPLAGTLAVLTIAFFSAAEAFSCGASISLGLTRSVTTPPPFSRRASQLTLVVRQRPAAAHGVRATRSLALSDAGTQLRSLAAGGDRAAILAAAGELAGAGGTAISTAAIDGQWSVVAASSEAPGGGSALVVDSEKGLVQKASKC
ncbi:hypothetical protein T484DRAFT_1861722 [Baffinella frigidus]|nr:hypothetical protein T484DRAFT_1861722 [Cryptophyta sp. CCMP2293]